MLRTFHSGALRESGALLALPIVAAFLLAGAAAADGSGRLGLKLQFRGAGAGYIVVADPRVDSGSIVIAGLPAGVTLTKAYFYCHDVAAAPSITGATLNGHALRLNEIGTMDSTNPGLRIHAYRADVTALFAGEGAYAWTTQSGGTNRGAALALFGTNPGDTEMWEVQLYDGAHGGLTADGSEALWPNPVVFGNFLAPVAWPVDGEITWVVAGGDPGQQEQYLVESSSVAGNDPAQQAWSVGTYSVTHLMTPAMPSLTANCRELGDAIVWMLGVIRVKVCDPCAQPFCAGDGSGPVPCPCTSGVPGSGCANSWTGGARLLPRGTVQPDTLVLQCWDVVPNSLTILFQGDASTSGAPFGDGLRCVGGRMVRMYSKVSDGGGYTESPGPGDPSLSARSAASGDPLTPGMTRWYQLFYRDASPLYCTPATFNTSSGVQVPW